MACVRDIGAPSGSHLLGTQSGLDCPHIRLVTTSFGISNINIGEGASQIITTQQAVSYDSDSLIAS